MVADILMRVDTAEFQAFMDKWSIMSEDEFTLSSEQREQMEQELRKKNDWLLLPAAAQTTLF